VGKSEDNTKLSQRRAESVKRFLGSLGVDPKRLEAVGKGDTQPKADNNLEEGRLMNRRVEVQLTNTEFVTTTRTKVELVPEEGKNKEKKKNHP
jgi:OOP family OmpA-OmpF porin